MCVCLIQMWLCHLNHVGAAAECQILTPWQQHKAARLHNDDQSSRAKRQNRPKTRRRLTWWSWPGLRPHSAPDLGQHVEMRPTSRSDWGGRAPVQILLRTRVVTFGWKPWSWCCVFKLNILYVGCMQRTGYGAGGGAKLLRYLDKPYGGSWSLYQARIVLQSIYLYIYLSC